MSELIWVIVIIPWLLFREQEKFIFGFQPAKPCEGSEPSQG